MSRQSSFSLLRLLLFLAVLGAVIAAAAWFWFSSQLSPVSPGSTKTIPLSVSKGQSLDAIAVSLKDNGLIRSIPAFKIKVMLSGSSTRLQAGDFNLSPGFSVADIIQSLQKGSTDRSVTFIEGQRREQFAQAVVDKFSKNNPDYRFSPDDFLSLTKDKEGYLFPDTYSFPKDVTAAEVSKRLEFEFEQQTAGLPNTSGLTFAQAVILASLVEREALADAERPQVAGILIKRLEAGWPLQVDATVQYVRATRTCKMITCDWWPKDLTRADLELESPFNTYKNPGLPPAPISNPSLVSLKAALSPAASDYWYYIHDSKGQIHFAATLEEHNRNVRLFLGKS